MAATGVLEKRAKKHKRTPEQEFDMLIEKHRTIRAMANDLKCFDGTIIYWINKLGYKYDPASRRYVKKDVDPEPEHLSVA